MQDLETHVKLDYGRAIIIDKYDGDDECVWMSFQVPGGGAYSSMTKEQARQIVDAINKVLEAAQ